MNEKYNSGTVTKQTARVSIRQARAQMSPSHAFCSHCAQAESRTAPSRTALSCCPIHATVLRMGHELLDAK